MFIMKKILLLCIVMTSVIIGEPIPKESESDITHVIPSYVIGAPDKRRWILVDTPELTKVIWRGEEMTTEKPPVGRRSSVDEEAMVKCHTGYRDSGPRCREYVVTEQESISPPSPPPSTIHRRHRRSTNSSKYPALDPSCYNITWETATRHNNFGNCMKMVEDEDGYRYITSNSVPDFYMNPYCPIAIGEGYCTDYELDHDQCKFINLTCGEDNGAGSSKYGDFWVPLKQTFKIPLQGNPTRSDRPRDMYDIKPMGGAKSMGPNTGVAINGIGVQGPNDAGDLSIDDCGFQLACGGHVTPPLAKRASKGHLGGPPFYHFHKSPECLEPFRNASIEVSKGGRPYEHAQLMGWAIDGFGIYAYQDIGGAAPIVDECGGHFGPVDGSGEVVYHYHSRPTAPYHLACQGPSLSKCVETQRGTNYCHPGCGADVCVQYGTDEQKLRKYLANPKWKEDWLDKYTVNDFKSKCASSNSGKNYADVYLMGMVIGIVYYLY